MRVVVEQCVVDIEEENFCHVLTQQEYLCPDNQAIFWPCSREAWKPTLVHFSRVTSRL